MSGVPDPKKLGILINRPGKFKDQRWLAAHNAWNTEESPAIQCKSITELLDYGVRGLVFDIYGDDEDSLHLQHGHGNLITWCSWKKVRDEIKAWFDKNPDNIVTLFFESYLTGPADKMPDADKLKTPLGCLNLI